LICLTDNTNKFSSNYGITKIIQQIGTNIYEIQSPLTIYSDSSTSTLGYKYDAGTLITNTSINKEFFFEIPSVVNQYGSFVSTLNDFLLPCINSDYFSPTKTGNYKACIVNMGSKDYIFFGENDVAGVNDFAVNTLLAPYTSVCEIELGYTPPKTYNGREINGLKSSPTLSTPHTNNIDYCIHDGQYFFETSSLSIDDIVVKNTSNHFINGRTIQSQSGNGYKISTLAGGYTEGFQSPRASNKTWSKNRTFPISSAKSQYSSGTDPQVGNFIILHNDSIVSKVTNVTSSGSNWHIEITPNISFGVQNGSDLNLYTTYGTVTNGFYTPVDFDIYEGLAINRFVQTQSFYEIKSFDFYNQETNNIYENITYDEFQNSNSNIYNNNQYIIDTKVLLDLPNTGISDTFVIENFAQTLTNKDFSGNVFFRGTQKIRDDALTLPSQGTASYTYSSNMKIDFLTNINTYYYDGTGSDWNFLNGGIFYTGASIHYVPASYIEVGSSDAGTHGKLHFKVQGINTSNTTTEIERMTITSNGNVGIGTSSPSQTLDVDGGIKVKGTGSNPGLTMDNVLYVQRSGNGASYSSYDYHAFYTNSTSGAETGSERMRILSNGRVGIGTTSPGQKLSIQDGNLGVFNSSKDIMALFAGSYGNYLHIGCWNQAGSTSKNIVLNQYGGNVGIGTTSPAQKLHVAGNIQTTGGVYLKSHGINYLSNGNGDGASLSTGNVTFRSWWGIRYLDYTSTCRCFISTRSGTWYGNTASTSDDRCKREEVYIQDALNTILKLKPQNYKKYFNLDCSGQYQYESGLIAQEVYYDTPELQHLIKLPEDADLSGNPIPTSDDPQVDPDYSIWGSTPASVNYIGLIPYLIKAVQEQQEVIETEKTKNTTLETQITSILARLDILENS
jgi:hypothetical protein